jgi:hypothetical protein
VSWSGVTVCSSSAPDAACDGDGQAVQINAADANSTDWVLTAPAVGGASFYAPVYSITGVQVIACQQFPGGGQCPGASLGYVPPSALVFGLAAPYSPPFDISQLSTVTAGQAFAAGFLLVAMGFVIGKPISLLLGFIRS